MKGKGERRMAKGDPFDTSSGSPRGRSRGENFRNSKFEIRNIPRNRHPLLRRFLPLGISWRAAAAEAGLSTTLFYEFLQRRRKAEKKNPEPAIRAWIEAKEKAARDKNAVKTAPMLKRLVGLGIAVKQAAAEMGLRHQALSACLTSGVWPNRETLDAFNRYLSKQKEGGAQKMLTKISLPDEVRDHWGLARDPFTNEMESPEDIVDTKEISRAEKKIMVAVDKNGWVAVTGPVGCGKSTLLKKIEGRLERKKDVIVVKPRIIEKQYLGASHVCDSILQDLGTHVVLTHRTLEHKARLVGRTLEEAHRDGKKIVIMIDEAHLLRDEALLALKRIYEFEIGFKKLLSIVLVGQLSLARRLKTNFNLAEVTQRVDLYEIGSLNGAIGAYLKHKLERACGEQGRTAGMNGKEIFEPSSIKAMQERADTPLSINNLAAAALIAAWDLGEKHVTADIVKGIPGTF